MNWNWNEDRNGLYGRAYLWNLFFNELNTIHEEGIRLENIGGTATEVYAGDILYRTPRGWLISIFNDCNGWDYINDAVTPDGISLLEELDDDNCGYLDGCFSSSIYNPSREEQVKVWGFADV